MRLVGIIGGVVLAVAVVAVVLVALVIADPSAEEAM